MAGLRITAGGGLGGQQSLGLSALDIAELLHIFLGEEVSAPSELDQMQREALEELVRQWAGLVASVLKPDFGEVTCEVEVDSSNTVSDRPLGCFGCADGERAVTVQMTLDDVLTSALAEPAVAAPVRIRFRLRLVYRLLRLARCCHTTRNLRLSKNCFGKAISTF